MIRLFYWLLALIEVVLLIAMMFLFIITDSRTVKSLADNIIPSTVFSYDSIEGNFFTGLEVKNLKYENKKLFDKALLRWNPIRLLNKSLTLTDIDVKGVELENIMKMIEEIGSSSDSTKKIDFNYTLSLNNIHLDINPYLYNGVEFSSFIFETENIDLSSDLMINTEALYLYFDSDLGNVELAGKIENRNLLLERLNLTEIDSKRIESFIKSLELKSSGSKKIESQKSHSILKKVKVKHLFATLKDVEYNSLKIKETELTIRRATLNLQNFKYRVKKLKLKGETNLASIEATGEIKESRLLLDTLNLLEIDIDGILEVLHAWKEKRESPNQQVKLVKKSKPIHPIFKEMKISHIYATLKDIAFKHLSIRDTALLIDGAEIDPVTFNYGAESLKFKGDTNLGRVDYLGYIENSTILAKGSISLSKELFEKYNLPLNYETLHYLPGSLKLNHQGVWIDVEHDVTNLLTTLDSDFNLDVTKGVHKIHYDYSDRNLSVDSRLKVNMPYGDEVEIRNFTYVDMDGKTTYEGEFSLPKLKALPSIATEYLLEQLNGEYRGDISKLIVDVESPLLRANFTTYGYKDAILKFETKGQNILLDRVLSTLPNGFRNEWLSANGELFLDFKNSENSKIDLEAYSNIINVALQMNLNYLNRINFRATIPNNSRLFSLNPNINLTNINQLEGEVLIDNDIFTIRVDNQNGLYLSLIYDANRKTISNGKIRLGAEEIFFSQNDVGEMEVNTHIMNIQSAIETIKQYYNINLPPIEGAVDIDVHRDVYGVVTIALKSPNLKYLNDSGVNISVINIYDIDTLLKIDSDLNIEIDHYRFNIDKNEYMSSFFSERKAYLSYFNNKIFIKSLWLNNFIFLSGEYNLETSEGSINLKSDDFPYKNEDFDLLFALDLNLNINKDKLAINGDIDILGKRIYYEMSGSQIVEDSDIIIVQEMLKKQESPMRNIRLDLKIKSKNPLQYITKDIDIEFYNELSVIKNYNMDMMVTGMSTITKGFYRIEDKKFTLDESHIYFVGDPKKPLLDIKANYIKDAYTVHIFISGSVDEPIVNFNSDPYLKQQEILSLILFDGTGSDGQGAEAYTLLGGTFAKGMLRSLGLNVDHLLLGTQNNELSLEIGKKFYDDITLMYMHKNGRPGAKVRIEHSNKFETDIVIMPPNTSSIEFLYKQD